MLEAKIQITKAFRDKLTRQELESLTDREKIYLSDHYIGYVWNDRTVKIKCGDTTLKIPLFSIGQMIRFIGETNGVLKFEQYYFDNRNYPDFSASCSGSYHDYTTGSFFKCVKHFFLGMLRFRVKEIEAGKWDDMPGFQSYLHLK